MKGIGSRSEQPSPFFSLCSSVRIGRVNWRKYFLLLRASYTKRDKNATNSQFFLGVIIYGDLSRFPPYTDATKGGKKYQKAK